MVSPGARPQAVLHTGRGRSGVSRAAGMRGLWSLQGAGRRETEVWLGTHRLERHGILKDMLCPRLCRRLGHSTGRVGEEGAVRDSQGSHSSPGAWRRWQACPNSFFLPVPDFPLETTLIPCCSCLVSDHQPAPGGARGLPEAAASLHSKTSKARCQSIPR